MRKEEEEDDDDTPKNQRKGRSQQAEEIEPVKPLEPLVVGDKVVLIDSPQELLDSFRGTPYDWEPAMNQILGQTMKVLEVRESGHIIGLEKSDFRSHNPIWFYSRTIVKQIVKDFHAVLRAGVDVLAFLSLSCASPAFRASRDTRRLFSALMSVHLSFSVSGPVETESSTSFREARRRCFKVRERLPEVSTATPVSMFVRLKVKEIPLKRASVNRSLTRAMPMVRWEECKKLHINSHENIEALDKALYKDVFALGGSDTSLLLMDRHLFRSLRKITFSLSQFLNLTRALGDDLCLPKIERVKVFCMDAGFCDEEFKSLNAAFPGIRRLHLVTLPAGLLPLCGPGIQAPEDLRMTLTEDSQMGERHANFFVASHLFSLPFSWETDFFRKVIRLQISELNEDLRGLSLEKFMESLKGLPHLRRLGTVSSRAAVLYDVSRDDCKLEELVLVTEFEDVKDFFSTFLSLEQRKKRGCLTRLAVHIVCSDGAARVKENVESAICAGWYNIAAFLMRANGWVVFSTASKALQETAIGQLPWYLPQQFSLDSVAYGERSLPCSTPLERPLPYYGTDSKEQPSGTLVSGPMRRSAQEAAGPPEMLSDSLSQSLASPSSPGTSSRPSGIGTSSNGRSLQKQASRLNPSRKSISMRFPEDAPMPSQEWMHMHLADSVEALMEAAERQRAEFSGM